MGNQTFCMAFFLAHLSPLSAPLGAAISGSKMLGVWIVSDRLNFALLDVPIWTHHALTQHVDTIVAARPLT